MYRGPRLWLPLIVIVIGIVVLLNNLGLVPVDALERLGDLWPLLLVILGLWLIVNHTLPRQQAALVGGGATAVIVIAALAYAVLAPGTLAGTQHASSSQRIGGLSAATLDDSYSASSIDIHSGLSGDTLYRANVDYPASENPPDFSVDPETGQVAISEGEGLRLHLFGSNRRHLAVLLTTRVAWTVRISGGASNLKMDLRELPLTAIELSGGASAVDVQLGAPKGTVGIQVSGGASDMTIRVPSGSQWNISVSGGVTDLTINGQRTGSAGQFQKQSSGYSGASNRFDIEISGGLSHLDFRTG